MKTREERIEEAAKQYENSFNPPSGTESEDWKSGINSPLA